MPPVIIPNFKFTQLLNLVACEEKAPVEMFLKQQHHPAMSFWIINNNGEVLYTAIRNGKLNTLKYLLEVSGVFKRKLILDEKYNLIYFASKQKNTECFEYLLNEVFTFAEHNDFRKNVGFEIYHEAVRENRYHVVRLLFDAEPEFITHYLNYHYYDNLIHSLEYPSGQMFKFLLHAADDVKQVIGFRDYLMIEMILSKSHAPALYALNEKFPDFLMTLPDAKLLRLAHQISVHHSELMLDTFLELLKLKGMQRLINLFSRDIIHELFNVGRYKVIEKLLLSAWDLSTFKKILKNIRSYDADEAKLMAAKYELIYQCMNYAESLIQQKPKDPIFLMPMLVRYQGMIRKKYLGFLMSILNEFPHFLSSTLILQKQFPNLLDKFVHNSQNIYHHEIHDLVPIAAGVMTQEYATVNAQHRNWLKEASYTAINAYANFLSHLQNIDSMLDYIYPLNTSSEKYNDFVHHHMGLQVSIMRYNPFVRCRYLFIDMNVDMSIVYELLTLICNKSLAHYESMAQYSPYSHWTVLDIGEAQNESEVYDYIFMNITPSEWVLTYAQTGQTLSLMMLRIIDHWIDLEKAQKITIDVHDQSQLLTI